MSDANRTALRYIEEVTIGTTPASPAFKELRYTSSALAYQSNTTTSEEIRSDRQITDLPLVGFEASGNTSHELSFDAFHDLFEGTMFNTWVLKPVTVNLVSDSPISDVQATTITVGATATNYKTGQLTLTSGFGTAANNKLAKMTADGAANNLTYAAATFTVEAVPPAGARVKVVGVEGVAGDLDFATGPNRITSTTMNFVTIGFVAGEWIKIGGAVAQNQCTVAANNGWARILSVAANTLTLDIVPSGWSASVETTTTVQIFTGDLLRNGVIEKGYTLEIEYAGMPVVEYEYYVGMEVSGLTFSADAQAIMKMEFNFMGFNASIGTSRKASATTVAAPTYDVMNTSSNVGNIREAGADVSTPNFVMSMSLSIDNGLRMQKAIGQAGAIGIGVGRANITGELQTYFGSSALLTKLRNNTASSFDFRVNDPAGGKAYIFDCPRIKFQSGNPEIEGIDTDIMVTLGFQAIRHATYGYTMSMNRFEYFV